MNITHLTYRLKGESEVRRASFSSFEEARFFLEDNSLQVVVGNPGPVKHPEVLFEQAAKKSHADWFEYSHEVME
jgi:hypothetical protein